MNIRAYIRQALIYNKNYKPKLNIFDLIRYYPLWERNLINNQNKILYQEIPWFTYPAIKFLKEILRKDMRVFEYGSGGSTIFFARKVSKVISIEHDPEWAKKINEILKRNNLLNCKVKVCEPIIDHNNVINNPSNPDSFVSSDKIYDGKSFKDYVKIIDNFDDNYFDIIVIDGRARPSCFKYSKRKLKRKGFIILDNSERKDYKYILDELKNLNWKNLNFNGPGPLNHYFWNTTISQRTN